MTRGNISKSDHENTCGGTAAQRGGMEVWLWWLLVLAVLIGVNYRTWILLHPSALTGDALMRYDASARNLVAGHGFSRDREPPYTPNTFDVPAYPIFVAAIYGATGGSTLAVLFVQGILELATLLLMAGIGRLLQLPRSAMLLAIGIGLVCPFLPTYAGVIMPEVATTFLLTAIAYLAIRGCLLAAAETGRAWWHFGGAGILVGVGTLMRAEMLGSTAIVILATVTLAGKLPISKRLHLVAALTFATSLALAPWMVWQYRIVGSVEFPGQRHFSGGTSGYAAWLSTWLDDPQWLADYWWHPLAPTGPTTFPASKVPDAAARTRAESALAIARRNGSFQGTPNQIFGDLAAEQRSHESAFDEVARKLRRTAWTWLRFPAAVRYPDMLGQWAKHTIYGVWIGTLGMALLGAGRVVLRCRRDPLPLVLLAVLASRAVAPVVSAMMTEPRYMIQALPAVFLLAALGLQGVALLMTHIARGPGAAVPAEG